MEENKHYQFKHYLFIIINKLKWFICKILLETEYKLQLYLMIFSQNKKLKLYLFTKLNNLFI